MSETTSLPLLLIVDDDPSITDTLAYLLGRDFAVAIAGSRPEAVERMDALPRSPDLALIDLGLPPTPHRPDEGFALIAELLARAPDIRIVVLSGQSEETHARHARALGAIDFVAKPADPAALRSLLKQSLTWREAESGADPRPGMELLGASLPMQRLREQLRQYARSPFPVLVEGESGSGKEIVAGSLHRLSDRASRPYLALNCAAISPTLVEPTLFGHAKGAFTGAAGARAGYFEEAGDGTLFLDEIGELPLELQPKLLRVLENGAFQRIGETQERISRARVVAATNRDLKKEVREGRFRADLYHRLSVFSIAVPPLREMNGDRLLLLDHFRRLYAAQLGQPAFSLTADAERRWRDYGFPGNVRELRNIVIRLATKHAGREVSAADLEPEFDPGEQGPSSGLPDTLGELTAMARTRLLGGAPFALDDTLRLVEQAFIDAAQDLTQGNISQAARLLGVHRTTLYNRIEALARSRANPENGR